MCRNWWWALASIVTAATTRTSVGFAERESRSCVVRIGGRFPAAPPFGSAHVMANVARHSNATDPEMITTTETKENHASLENRLLQAGICVCVSGFGGAYGSAIAVASRAKLISHLKGRQDRPESRCSHRFGEMFSPVGGIASASILAGYRP